VLGTLDDGAVEPDDALAADDDDDGATELEDIASAGHISIRHTMARAATR